MAESRRLSYTLELHDATENALHQMEGGLDKIHSAFIGIPTTAAAAAVGIVSVGAASEKIVEKIIEETKRVAELGVEWQHESSSLAAATDLSIEKAREMGDSFLKLGSDVPQSGTAITQAYEKVAGRLELFTGEARDVSEASLLMKTAAEGAVAGNQSLDAATGALVQQMLASHATIEEQERVMDVLFNTSRLTGSGYEELSTIMGRLQARMGESAPPIEDVGLAMVIMTEAGLSGARGMMVVTQMLNALTDPTDKARQDLDGLGVSIQKNADGSLNLRGTLGELTAAFSQIDDPIQRHALAVELVGKEYAGVFESAMKSAAGNLDGLADKVAKSNSAHEAAEKHADDLAERIEKARHRADAFAQILGEGLADALVKDADLMATVGESFDVMLRNWQAWQRRNASEGSGARDDLRQAGLQHVADEYADQLRKMAGAGDEWATAEVARFGRLKDEGHRWSEAELAGLREVIAARAEAAGFGEERLGPRVSEQGTNALPRAPLDSAAIQANAEAMRALGSEGQKFHNIILDIQHADLPSDLAKGLNELSAAETAQAEKWARGFDPENPAKALQNVAALKAATDEFAAAAAAHDQTRMTAAAAAIDSINRRVTAEEAAAEHQNRLDQFHKQQAAEAKRLAEEAARAIHDMAITGFDEGTARNELVQKWGKLGSDSIVALTEALKDPAHMRSAGEALSNSVAQLTEHLHEAGVPEWEEAGRALTSAFRLAIQDGTPENVQAAQELLSQTVEVLSSTEMWAEWEKAAKSAGDKVNVAVIETADRIEQAWEDHQTKMQELDARYADKDRIEKSREAVEGYVTGLKTYLDKQVLDQRQADQDIIESMRLLDQQRDSSLQQARQTADAETSRMRSRRDEGIQTERAESDALREHQQRLADIAKHGDPGGTQAAAENESFRRSQDSFNLQQQRAREDRQRAEQDAAVDMATKITREQADRSRHEADALALKSKEHELASAEQTQNQTNADDLKHYKLTLEEQFHIDKASLDAAEKTRQIKDIDDRYDHETQAAQKSLERIKGAADAELSTGFDTIQKKFPWVTQLAEFSAFTQVSAPPATQPLLITGGTSFIPTTLPGAAPNAPAQPFTVGQINIDNHGIMGEGAGDQIANAIVAAEEAVLVP